MTDIEETLKPRADESFKNREPVKTELKTENGAEVETEELSKQAPSFCQRILQDRDFRRKFIHTMVLCWSFVGYGWIAGMTGPTFPDLRQIVGEDLATSTWMFTVGSFGFMVGSLGGGYLFDKFNKEGLLAMSQFGMAVSQGVTPYCNSLSTLLVARFFVGIFCGVVDTGGNADIYYVWGKNGGSYMQALHFGFSVGALLAPLATEPFLANKILTCANLTLEISTESLILTTDQQMDQNIHLNTTNSNNTSKFINHCEETYETSGVHPAFILSGVLCFSSSVGFFCVLFMPGAVYTRTPETQDNNEDSNADRKQIKRKKLTVSQNIFFLVMICLQISSYCVIEDTFAGFLMTFCLAHLNWSKSQGSFATAAFWIAFAIGRFLGIFLTRVCKQTFMLSAYLVLMAIGLVGFYIGVNFFVVPVIWIFTVLLGASMSIIFPAFFTWTSKNVIPIKGRISSVIFTCLVTVGMAFPVMMGNMMEYYGPMWFVYILLIAMTYCLLHFVVLRLLVRIVLKVKTAQDIDLGRETELSLIEKK